MASENGQGRRETLADIVAEIRAYGAQPPPRLMWLEIADRIESAWKRENAEWKAAACACVSDAVMSGKVAVEHVPVGNAAAMREALNDIVGIAKIALNVNCVGNSNYSELWSIIDKCKSALSAPPRQCDVGTAEEQIERLYGGETCPSCKSPQMTSDGCACVREGPCALRWAQTPYEEHEGGAE